METKESLETSESTVSKTTNKPWGFKQFLKNLFRRKENIERIEKGDTKQLLEQHRIANTPFTAVKFEDKWFLTMGKYRLTEPLKSKHECEQEAKDASWNRLMAIMKIVIMEHEAEKELVSNLKTKDETFKNQKDFNGYRN